MNARVPFAPPSTRRTGLVGLFAAAVLGAILAALGAGCRATSGSATALPWCRATRLGERADLDSALIEIRVSPDQEGSAAGAAIAAAAADAARRRGYIVGSEGSRSRWVVRWVDRPSGGTGPGHEPYDADGRFAALADRLRRESPRSGMPTQAAVEILFQKFGVTLWTGEVRFDPDPVDSLRNVDAYVRSIVWQLPRYGVPAVPVAHRLAPEDVVGYYERELQGVSFVCPVLPYRIRFPDLEREYMRGGRTLHWEDTKNRHAHEHPTLLPAYLELLLHAESAIPKPVPGYPDVTAAELWRDATLAATFRDEAGEELTLELRVKGDTRGYEVKETRVLDAREAEARRRAVAELTVQLTRRAG